MSKRLIPLFLIGSLSTSGFAETFTYTLDIRPNRNAAWGASMADVSKVLHSSAAELYQHFPDRNLKPILVEPKGGPIVLFRRGANGEFHVKLDTGKTYWAQYAFQFAHEFCHILCRYDDDKHHNKWFEESICEAASLFSLRAMSETWKRRPPYPNWKSYAPHLKQYADERLESVAGKGKPTLAAWYARERAALEKSATLREKNLVVAAFLLPILEKNPEYWEAVGFLNVIEGTPDLSFPQYLKAWYHNAPRKHGPFINQVAAGFGIDLNR